MLIAATPDTFVRDRLTRREVFTQIWERYSDEIITDGCAVAVASWFTGAAAMATLAAGGQVEHGDLMWAIHDHARPKAGGPREHAALDMLYAWAMVKAIAAGAAGKDQYLDAVGMLGPAVTAASPA